MSVRIVLGGAIGDEWEHAGSPAFVLFVFAAAIFLLRVLTFWVCILSAPVCSAILPLGFHFRDDFRALLCNPPFRVPSSRRFSSSERLSGFILGFALQSSL